jgi:hypothetical protein
MTSRLDPHASRSLPPSRSEVNLTGWVIFGGVVLGMLGVINIVQGITALSYDELLVASYVYDDLTFWGWAFLVWGALQLAGGVLTLMGNVAGPALGIGLATISAIGWFFMIFAAPTAALVGIAVSVAVIASLSAAVAQE